MSFPKHAPLFRGQDDKRLPGGLALAGVEQIKTAAESIINSS
jgi:hypothetical protein